MNFKKVFITTSLIILFLFIIIIILLLINSSTAKCLQGHQFNDNTSVCTYIANNCLVDEYVIEIKGQRSCSYSPKGFMDNGIFTFLIILLIFVWVILLIVYLFSTSKKDKPIDISTFKKEDYVFPDLAMSTWALKIARDTNIPIIDNKYDLSCFDFFVGKGQRNVFQKGKEWFLKFSCSVTDGTNPGVYTVILSLSRSVNWIKNGNFNMEQVNFDDYKISRNMPIHTSEDPRERLLEQLWEREPEKAMDMQQQLIEKAISSPSILQNQQAPEGQPAQIIKQPVRRSWYKGRGYRER